MVYKRRRARAPRTIQGGQITLWLAVHEAGHVIARIQLLAAWNLTGLGNPVALESVHVWIDQHRQPRGLCQWGYKKPLSFRYQAIISAAGPVAEARIRHAKRYDCLITGEDFDIIMRSKKRGLADLDEALSEASFIVRASWPEIMKLALHLQTHRDLTFLDVSAILDLKNGRRLYDETTRPSIRYGA